MLVDNEALLRKLVEEITLNQTLLNHHVQEEYGGNLSAFGRSLVSGAGEQPHRATILRWVSDFHKGLPKSAKRLKELAQTLDVDPFLLLKIREETFKSLCSHSSWITQWGKYHKSLTFLSDLVGLGMDPWPAAHLASDYEGHWQTWDLEHTAREQNNYFFSLVLQPEIFYDLDQEEVVEKQRQNQVWYIATRDAKTQADALVGHGLWKPFGIFFIQDHQLNLLNLGTGEWLTTPFDEDCFDISFYCGPGSSIFRVASLHPFEVMPDEHKIKASLRYTFPE